MKVNVNVICLTKTTRQLVYRADFATFPPALCFSSVESGNAILILRVTLVLGVVNSGNSASEPRFLRFGEFRRRASVPRS